jgi:hypothetical protein
MSFIRKFSVALVFMLTLCIAPISESFAQALPAGYVSQGGLTWMPVSSTIYDYAGATALCAGTINGQTGWRLPTLTELSGLTGQPALGTIATGGLYGSGAMTGQGWTLSYTWSSTPASTGGHYYVYLGNGFVSALGATDTNNVTCVRSSSVVSGNVTNAQLFAYAAANYAGFFSGTPTSGTYGQYTYQYYPTSQTYLAIDNAGVVYGLGGVLGKTFINIGTITAFAPAVTAWQATQPSTLPAGYVSQGGLTWMPVSSTIYDYAGATALCAGTINGQTGWRLPTLTELSGLTGQPALGTIATGGLYGSGAMTGQGWKLSYTWSSTPASTGGHYYAQLDSGSVYAYGATDTNYTTCVRSSSGVSGTQQTIGAITFSPTTLAVGGSATVSATASSGLAVSFSSTTPNICTLSGNTANGVAVGTCTIAADQAGNSSYSAASEITQSIQVTAPTCASFQVLKNGVCVTPTPPASQGGYVLQGGLIWMPISSTSYYTYAQATSLCAGTINGQAGWRLPTLAELSGLSTPPGLSGQNSTGGLYGSGAMNGQGWTLFNTWSSTPYSDGGYYIVYLHNGVVSPSGPLSSNSTSFVTCVMTAPTCTPPQVLTNGVCAAPPAGYVSQGGLTWMPASLTTYGYAGATALCAGTINGEFGWRLPTQAELSGFYSAYPNNSTPPAYGNSALLAQGWALTYTWSTGRYDASSHWVVSLYNGGIAVNGDTYGTLVTCVR